MLENDSLDLSRFDRHGSLARLIRTLQWDVVIIAFLTTLFSSFAFAQDRTPLTVNQISDLLKSGVTSTRIARLVEQRGVGFELTEAALRRLRADGADEVVLSSVKKMAQSAEERRRRTRLDGEQKKQGEAERAEEVRRRLQEQAKQRELEKRRAEALSRQKSVEESKSGGQREARQRPQKATSATLMTQEAVGRVASLRNLTSSEGGEVSGELVNNTRQTLRDVQLQIVYSWSWKNEYHPGKDDPGTARYYVLNQEILPGQTVRFKYNPSPPLASRQDGHFNIDVKIVGFAQVFQPGAQR
jgi:hypothetical protein